ncbi:MAG: hypothetical protein ABW000_09645 [Actinoplanes sp.]
MTTGDFAPLPLPAVGPGGDRTGTAAQIAAWTDSPALAALVAAFGGVPPRPGPAADRLAELDGFSAEHCDYRKGRERADTEGETFPPATDALIRAAVTALGLLGRQSPPGRAYDHLLVHGGGARTMVARAGLAAALLRDGVTAAVVTGLGSERVLPAQEPVARERGLPGGVYTEGDAADDGLRLAFGLTAPAESRSGASPAGQRWWVRSYPGARPPVHILSAASTRPGLRANTADTLTGWAEFLPSGPAGCRLLMVTSDLFVPFQHCDAVRLLGLRYGCAVDTVGYPNPHARTWEYLQELRSAIHSMQGLERALSLG